MQNKVSFEITQTNGLVRTGKLIINNIIIETPNFFPDLRTTQRPSELNLLISEKGKSMMEHIGGAIVRLYNMPILIEPNTIKLAEEEKNRQFQKTLDDKPIPRSPYSIFYNDNLMICDPSLEYTHIVNSNIDEKFLHFDSVPLLRDYFTQFYKNKKILKIPTSKNIRDLRDKMHDDFWFSSNKTERKERNQMLTDLTRYQLQHFHISIPGSHIIKTKDHLNSSIDINEFCQGLAYQAGKECATYLPLEGNVIKNDEIIGNAIDYLRQNKQSKLNVIKLKNLDLHCPVDYRARASFRNLLTEINDIKEDQKDRAFMLLEAGTQYYVALQTFDIVSTTLTGNDKDVNGGKRTTGVKYFPLWYDERKMWTRPVNDIPSLNPEHCNICSEIEDPKSLDDDIIGRKRRIHRLNDLNNDAKKISDAVQTGDVSLIMKQRVAYAEFSYARDLIF